MRLGRPRSTPKSKDKTLPRAKQLRRTMSTPERKLWNLLRAHQTDFKFRRQHPLGPYSADFYCTAATTVIELDGSTHRTRRDHDAARDAWMQTRGLHILRIPVPAFERNPAGAVRHILEHCRKHQKPRPSTGSNAALPPS
jgi:very-short-patch-repair endonuclease